MTNAGEITRIIESFESGDSSAAEELLPLVYEELRQLAANQMARERQGQTLEPTALVHEAYLRLVKQSEEPIHWNGRKHFFGAAAEAMRRILIEVARRKQSRKHGGHLERLDLRDTDAIDLGDPDHILAVNDALESLAVVDGPKAELVKLRFFAGLTIPEAAAALEISDATAERWWAFTRAWLGRELLTPTHDAPPSA